MGRNRYYCDYCDRSFKDVQSAREKHLASVQHIKNRNEYYNNLKDPEQILQEEQCKKPCTRFMNYQDCPFGTLCRYSHYTPQALQQLRQIVAEREQLKHTAYDPDPEQIIKEYFEDTVDPEIAKVDFELWSLPPELKDRPDLPPSLQPITYKNFQEPIDYPEWGWR